MKKKAPVELNKMASFIIDQATNEEPEAEETPTKNPAAVALGKLGGLKGGKARAAMLTSARKKEIASLAAQSRWKKHREASDEEEN